MEILQWALATPLIVVTIEWTTIRSAPLFSVQVVAVKVAIIVRRPPPIQDLLPVGITMEQEDMSKIKTQQRGAIPSFFMDRFRRRADRFRRRTSKS